MSVNEGESEKTDDVSKQNSTQLEIQKDILPGFATFDDYMKTACAAIQAGIKVANVFPKGDDFKYYASFPTFQKKRSEEIGMIMDTMQNIIEMTGAAAGSMKRRDFEDKYDLLAEANDFLLDRANTAMDDEEGVRKKPTVELIVSQTKQNNYGSWNTGTTLSDPKQSGQSINNGQAIRLLAGKNIERPQLSFKDKIDNSQKPWEPRINDKPNSIKPLAIYLIDGENGDIYCHPYECELDKFSVPENQLTTCKPMKYKTLEETPLIVIEKPEDLKIMMTDLLKYNEMAVDLEHHSYRTFQGITCLLQISTRDTDYLIDTLTLRSELHVLNEVFTKPSILKVFHGADSDIQWLQRDLSLYVVNMFDTHQAAKHLNLPYLSLAYLLKTHCGVDPNKHFQLADWRMRPLPEELMKYAREDTHYLLYIKDILQNELINIANGQSNILKAVYDRSTEVCKKIYEKPICNEDSYMSIYRKSKKMFNNRQLYALKELFLWRDATARQEDDSVGYVLPNHMLLNIAETLPREMQGILACCNPIPPLVRQNLLKLHKLILKARDQSLIKPVLEQDIRQRLNESSHAMEADVWIWSPHDIPSGMEVQANLPCLLDSNTPQESSLIDKNIKHTVTIFDSPVNSEDEGSAARQKFTKAKKKFISPFERYKLVIPMVAAQEAKERAQKEKEHLEKVEKERKLAEETARSIERVHEHFVEVSKVVTKKEIIYQKKVQTPLSSMPGSKKRKRGADTKDDIEIIEEKFNATTPQPSSDTTFVRGHKRKSDETSHNNEHHANKKIDNKNQQLVKGIRAFSGSNLKTKNQKKTNFQELQQKGMLPQPAFDYKSVDFSSFQGGSKKNPAKAAPFQQKQFKDKLKKGRKKKKEKIGI